MSESYARPGPEAPSGGLLSAPKRKRRILTGFTYFVVVAVSLLTAFPFLWSVSTSFKTREGSVAYPPTLLPSNPTLESYRFYFTLNKPTSERTIEEGLGTGALVAYPPDERGGYVRWFLNTVLVTVLNAVGVLFVSALAGYVFARLEFVGKRVLLILLLSPLMIPGIMFLLPRYTLFRRLGMVGSLYPLFVPDMIGGWPLALFLYRQHFLSIPRELSEAAIMDGATHWQIFWRIMMPLSKQIMATLGVLVLVFTWNALLEPLVYVAEPKQWTLSLALFNIARTAIGEASVIQVRRQLAGAVLVTAPVIIAFFFAQRYFIAGLTEGAVKQ